MVSVVVPNFNHERYLKERISSILNQSYSDFEVIILDDASTDNSVEEISKFQYHPKVKKVCLERVNSGSPFGLWNKAFKMASGDFIWIAESDDIASPFFLERLMPFFENEDVVISHCQSMEFAEFISNCWKNNWLESFEPNIWRKSFVSNGNFILEKYGRFKCPVINVSSAIFRKKALFNILIPDSYRYCGDWFFWSQMFLQGLVAFDPMPLNYIRIHASSATMVHDSLTINKVIENTVVARKVNKLCGRHFEFNANYDWLLLMWKREIVKRPIVSSLYFLWYAPRTFLKAIANL